jgi:hypothetical protein
MSVSRNVSAWIRGNPWAAEFTAALLGLALGVGVMPMLIYYAGAGTLGRYDGASLERQYASLFAGLQEPSVPCWVVILGPYGLFLLWRGLAAWWRLSAKLA